MTYVNWALTSKAMGKKETNFKQTDIGLIPHDWEVEKLEDITSFPTSKIRSTDINVCTYISTENMLQNNLGVLPFNGEVLPSNVREYKRGDILVSNIRPYLRKSYLATQSGGCSSDVIVFRPLGKIRSDYLHMCLSSSRYATEVTANSTGTKMPRGCLSFIRQFQVPLPPIEEQKRIAEVLSHFDEHIDNLAALLEKRKQVKVATMQALLSGTTRLPGFTTSWKRKPLCNLVGNIRTGKLDANAMTDHGEYPFFTCDSKVYKTDTYAFDCEAILISGNGSQIGHTNYYSGKFNAYQRTYVISEFVANVTYLLYYVKCFFREYLKTETNISSIPFITMPVLKDFPIYIPGDEKVQEAIADILSNMDRGIEALEQEIKKYRQMKEGAMEELLTGKVRLI